MTAALADATAEPLRLLVHGQGLPVQGAMLRFEFGANSLRIEELDGHQDEVGYDSLTTRPGGWSGESLLLEWEGPAGSRAVLLDEPERFGQIIEALPQDMRRRMEGWRKDVRRSRRVLHVGLVVVIAATLLPLFAVSILMLNARGIANKALPRIPVVWEQQLGAQTLAGLYLDSRVIHHGPAHAQFTTVANSLLQHVEAPYDWQILLVKDGRRGALALPGGTIVVWSGLLQEMRNSQELAGILAHEIEHVEFRHSLQGIVHAMGLRTALRIVLFGFDTKSDAILEGMPDINKLAYTRSQEIAADGAALDLLRLSGWQQGGLASLLARMSNQSNEPLPFFTTHPPGWEDGASMPLAGSAAQAVVTTPAWQVVLDDLQTPAAP